MIVRILREEPETNKATIFVTSEDDLDHEFVERLIKDTYEYLGTRAGTKILERGSGNQATTNGKS